MGPATLLVLLGLLAAAPAQVRRPVGDPLGELTDAQLFEAAWARQKLDLDSDGAIQLYRYLVKRKGNSLHRQRAIIRLLDVYRSRGNIQELGKLLRELSKDSTLPADQVEKFAAAADLIERRGDLWAKAISGPKTSYDKARDLAKDKDSSTREALRQAFFDELDKTIGRLREDLRRLAPDFSPRSRDWFEPRQAPRPTQPASTRLELRNRWTRLYEEQNQLLAKGRRGSPEWQRVEAEIERVKSELLHLLESGSPPEGPDGPSRRRLRVLLMEIDQLSLAGRHDDADRQIDRALALQARLDYRPPANLRAQLQHPLLRRDAVRGILDRIDQNRERLAELRAARPDDVEAAMEFARQVKPLVAAKRWREAAETALVFLDWHPTLQRLWQQK
jgi:hypothetical protein